MMHRYLLFCYLFFTTLSARAQRHDMHKPDALRNMADSTIQVTLMAWPLGNEADESTYKQLDSTIARYRGADTLHTTKYMFGKVDTEDWYITANGRVANRYSYFRGSKAPTVYAYWYCDEGETKKDNYSNNTLIVHNCYNTVTRTDTIIMQLAPNMVDKQIRRYDDKGILTAMWRTGMNETPLYITYTYNPQGLPVEEKHYVHDTLTAIHTYTYTMDNRGNYTKRNHYIDKRLYRVLYRRIYYN